MWNMGYPHLAKYTYNENTVPEQKINILGSDWRLELEKRAEV